MIDGMLRLLLFMGNEIIPKMNILRNFNHDKVLYILKHIKIQKSAKIMGLYKKKFVKNRN